MCTCMDWLKLDKDVLLLGMIMQLKFLTLLLLVLMPLLPFPLYYDVLMLNKSSTWVYPESRNFRKKIRGWMQTSKCEMPTLRARELKSSFSSLVNDSIVIKHKETSYRMSESMYRFLFLFWSGLFGRLLLFPVFFSKLSFSFPSRFFWTVYHWHEICFSALKIMLQNGNSLAIVMWGGV